jgi:hypothetical protein
LDEAVNLLKEILADIRQLRDRRSNDDPLSLYICRHSHRVTRA